MDNQKDGYFFCYNKFLSDWLSQNSQRDIKYITVAIEPKSGKLFSLYKIDDNLQAALKEYKEQKQN